MREAENSATKVSGHLEENLKFLSTASHSLNVYFLSYKKEKKKQQIVFK